MRVGLVGNPSAGLPMGGGEIQLIETRRALERLGVAASVWSPERNSLDEIDCLHLFGSHRHWLPLVEAARRASKPVALSTIAWFDLSSRWREAAPLAARLRGAAGYLARAAFPRLPSWRRRLYHAVDLLLPNSQAEASQLERLFDVPRKRIRVVPNGAHPGLASASPAGFAELLGCQQYVLCAGRIEPRKNQLALIRALAGHQLTLAILGDVVTGHEDYADRCRREAGAYVRFIPALDHDDPLLASALAGCSCLALPSWFETPGLAALEAAMSGAPLVLTDRGATREYFGPLAYYVSPDDPGGMRDQVERAVAAGRNPALAEMARQRYTWAAVAQASREAYATLV